MERYEEKAVAVLSERAESREQLPLQLEPKLRSQLGVSLRHQPRRAKKSEFELLAARVNRRRTSQASKFYIEITPRVGVLRQLVQPMNGLVFLVHLVFQ